MFFFFFFQAEDGIRDFHVTGVQTCALPICQTADQVIEANAARPQFGFGEIDDHCFARWLADLAQSTDDKCKYERTEIIRVDNGDWEKRETKERDDHKRFSSDFVRDTGGRNIDQQ